LHLHAGGDASNIVSGRGFAKDQGRFVRIRGRRCGKRGRIGAILLAWVLVLFPGSPRAQDAPERITIVVFGDSQAQGLAGGLQRMLVEKPRFRVLNRTHPGAALVHEESEWIAPIRKFLSHEQADIAVVMFGANDRLDMRPAGAGAYLHFKTDPWREEYARRIEEILTAVSGAGLKVIWCGNPIARSPTYSADMVYINRIYAEQAERFGVQFVPLWQVIADAQGDYAAYGKYLDGVNRRLRADDGIHFTASGYELIAEKILTLIATPAGDAATP
jgi:hypothetical protein